MEFVEYSPGVKRVVTKAWGLGASEEEESSLESFLGLVWAAVAKVALEKEQGLWRPCLGRRRAIWRVVICFNQRLSLNQG